MPNECSDVRDRLFEITDAADSGAGISGELAALSSHATGCPTCQKELADLRAFREAGRQTLQWLSTQESPASLEPASRQRPAFMRMVRRDQLVDRVRGHLAGLSPVERTQILRQAAGSSISQVSPAVAEWLDELWESGKAALTGRRLSQSPLTMVRGTGEKVDRDEPEKTPESELAYAEAVVELALELENPNEALEAEVIGGRVSNPAATDAHIELLNRLLERLAPGA